MSSILTNRGAISALDTLRSINSSLAGTQSRISTGLRISTASDNAAYWSIATTMRADTKGITAVADSIGLGQAILDTAYLGMKQVLEYLDEIKKLVVVAAEMGPAQTSTWTHDYVVDPVYDGTSHAKLDKQIRGLFRSILTVVESSSFNGVNLLKVASDGPSVQSSIGFVTGLAGSKILTTNVNRKDTVLIAFNRDGDYYDYEAGASGQGLLDGKIAFVYYDQPITYNNGGGVGINADLYVLRSGLAHYNHVAGYNSLPLSTYYDALLDSLDDRMESINNGMSAVGAVQKSMAISAEFTQARIDTNNRGMGRLVDADMNEESTRLKALQTQQQLGIQALQIANASTDKFIELFR